MVKEEQGCGLRNNVLTVFINGENFIAALLVKRAFEALLGG